MKLVRAAAALACLLAARLPLRAQTPTAAQEGAVRVFLDCNGFHCDPDFYQTEIAFVTHVRDRSDADVHVLATAQSTAAGGAEYTLAFLGQGRFAGDTLTLRHTSEPNASEDARRQGLAQVIKLGLVRYVAQTPQAARLSVTYAAPQQAAPAAAERDPWNHWTFSLSGQGFVNGEQSISSRYLYGSVAAGRTTERWKLRLAVNVSENHSRFEVDSTTVYTSTQTTRGASGLLVRSLGARLSAGVVVSASRNSFINQDLAVRIAPAVEYNVYPYAEATRREFIFRYSVGPVAYDYDEETIFERTSETRVQQALVGSLVSRQPWGTANVRAEAASFVNNFKQNRLQIGGGVELNLLRGLSLNVEGWYDRLRDQLYLPAGEASEEEILLRRRQLATGYQYFGALGFSYTFGSRFRSVVNPRFRNAGN
jgi:hypothetical protein